MKLIIIVLLAAVVTADLEEDREVIFEARNVTLDKNVRSIFCNDCPTITIVSTGGALEHQPQRLVT
jgi:hypothetical protein